MVVAFRMFDTDGSGVLDPSELDHLVLTIFSAARLVWWVNVVV